MSYAVVPTETGRVELSRKFYEACLEKKKKVRGVTHFRTLITLSNLCSMLGMKKHTTSSESGKLSYQEILSMHLESLRAREETLGCDHPDTLGSKNNLACLYATHEMETRKEEAVKLLQDCLSKRIQLLGKKHPDALASKHNLELLLRLSLSHSNSTEHTKNDFVKNADVSRESSSFTEEATVEQSSESINISYAFKLSRNLDTLNNLALLYER